MITIIAGHLRSLLILRSSQLEENNYASQKKMLKPVDSSSSGAFIAE
tara:strand:- start:140 stop:280 length:141 start_codon:yes stop_codon:yes gene_type:complete